MDYNTIQQLLERYFNGDTSLRDEAQLRRYFAGPDIDERLRRYQPLFRYLQAEQARTTSTDFDDNWQSPPARTAKIRRLGGPRTWFIGIAAMLALALGLWFLAPAPEVATEQTAGNAIDWSKYEPKSEEEAIRLTRTALIGAATHLNAGARQAAKKVKRVKTLADPTR